MTNQRNLRNIATGLGLTDTDPTEAERIAAAKALDIHVSDNLLLDPAGFAREMDGILGGQIGDEWLGLICPELHAAERQTLEALYKTYPALDGRGKTPWSDYQEAIFALALDLYSVGIRHGAAYEHLRRSVVGEISVCRGCFGAGVTHDDEACTGCGGTGTVAMKP